MATSADTTQSDEQFFCQQIGLYEPFMCEYLIPAHILPDLAVFIESDGMQRVKRAEQKSISHGVSELMQLLKECKKPGCFTAFVDGLKENGYEMLADHLRTKKEVKEAKMFKELLSTFCKHLVEDIDPRQLVEFLTRKNTLSKLDQADILNEDRLSGMFMLLLRLPLLKEGWCSDFTAALKSSQIEKYQLLANDIEDVMSKVSLQENRKALIMLCEPLLQYCFIASHISVDMTDFIGRDGVQKVQRAERSSLQEGVTELLKLILRSRKQECFTAFLRALEENEYKIIADHLRIGAKPRDADTFRILLSKFCRDLIDGVAPTDVIAILIRKGVINKQDVADVQNVIKMVNEKAAMATLLLKLPLYKDEWFSDFTAALKGSGKESYIRLANNMKMDLDKVNSESDTDNEEPSDEDIDNQMEISGEKRQEPENSVVSEPLDLRSYQRELAEPALKDKNIIIVAPTGSGKTHVALYITKNHLNSRHENKAVFLVPTTELVAQQAKMYHKYLNEFKTFAISGEVQASQKVPLNSLIENNHILVMTPQILLNALRRNDLTSLSVFTLMIFDECHHATKEHPYNNIMAMYIEEKYSEDRTYLLPQIVGLTASVGVGKAGDMKGAVKHILSLCANLDATDGISVVQQNQEELKMFVNKPNQEKIETYGRKVDPFKSTVKSVMIKIENHLVDIIGKHGIESLTPLNEVPPSRGCDQYTQWVSRLEKAVIKISNQDLRRQIYACQTHLKNYNTALMINEDCRTVDALDYLLRQFVPADGEYMDSTDQWLNKLFNQEKEKLTRCSQDPRYDNPKLNQLAKLILDKYQKNPDMRTIIFCKTREMTLALQNWIKEFPELQILQPNRLVGANAPADKGGMTQHKQEDVLKYFKDGKHKVIIATSVAEEGLDVSKCNLVIRYEYVTNEIAMVQARGRGRAEDSEYVVMGDQRRGAAQKEEINKIRENMMNKAIEQVKDMTDESRTNEIIRLQEEARFSRKMSEVGKEMKAASCPKDDLDKWELRCVKCDAMGCLASDIRVFEEKHHIVLDISFRERIKVEKHPKPKQYDEIMMINKIFCQRCHNDWGVVVIYKGTKLCVIKISSFILINVITGRSQSCKKWKNAPFSVNGLTPEELKLHVLSLMEVDDI